MRQFKIKVSSDIRGDYEMGPYKSVSEALNDFKYTLEVGQSWEDEKGNKKINMNPKSPEALCKQLYNAKNNAARNGYAGIRYEVEYLN